MGEGCELNRRRNEGRGSKENVSDGQRTDTRTESHGGLDVWRVCLFFNIKYIRGLQCIVNILYLTLDFVIIKY